MQEELWAEQRANVAYEAWRATAKPTGSSGSVYGVGGAPSPRPNAGTVNLTDPDSRIVQSRRGFMQGYTAQAVATKEQIVITADVIAGGNERQTLEPLIDRAHQELAQAGVIDTVSSALADAGFWNTGQIARLTDRGIRTLVSPDAGKRKTPGLTRQRRKHHLEMREQLATDEGKQLYRQRQAIIEPVFAQTKYNRRIDWFQRTGLWACRAEWRLITATHNLLKLWQHNLAIATG